MSTPALSPRQGPSAAHVVQLLQTAYPKHWENHIRNFLSHNNLGDVAPAGAVKVKLVAGTVSLTGVRFENRMSLPSREMVPTPGPVAP